MGIVTEKNMKAYLPEKTPVAAGHLTVAIPNTGFFPPFKGFLFAYNAPSLKMQATILA